MVASASRKSVTWLRRASTFDLPVKGSPTIPRTRKRGWSCIATGPTPPELPHQAWLHHQQGAADHTQPSTSRFSSGQNTTSHLYHRPRYESSALRELFGRHALEPNSQDRCVAVYNRYSYAAEKAAAIALWAEHVERCAGNRQALFFA
jgi:hypothetical protein